MPQSYRLSMAGGPAGGRPRLCSGGLGLVAGVAYGASQGLPCNHAMQRLRRLPLLGLLGLVWLLAAFPGAAGDPTAPSGTNFEVVGHVNRDQRIKLRASLSLPDDDELGLPIIATENAIALNGSAPPRLVSITTNLTDDVYGVGEEIPIVVSFTSPVVVEGSPALVLNTGCHADNCSTSEVQSFTCRADKGGFAVELPPPPGVASTLSRSILVNVPADASQDQLKYALESLDYIDEVTVWYGDSDDREYSHGPRACTSVGNNITITFVRSSYPNVDGDLPLLRLDWLNSPLDPRTYHSLGDGTFLSARFPGAKVGTSNPVELVKGRKMDDSRAEYVSGSGTSRLRFVYTVRHGDRTDLLDVKAFDTSTGSILSNATHEPADLSLLPRPFENRSVAYASATALSFGSSIVINTDPAYVLDVTTTNMDGVYTTGDVITVKVTFNIPVSIVPGAEGVADRLPYVYLNSGGVGGHALAHHTHGTAAYFKYRIREGDYAKDLDYFDTTSLILGNGSIFTRSSRPQTPVLTLLPPPGILGSISYHRDIVIDTTAPYVRNVTSPLANGEYGAGQEVPITVSFSTQVAVSGRPYLLVDTGPISRLFRGVVSVPTGASASFSRLPRAGVPADLQLNFSTNVPLLVGDVLTLRLPGFQGRSNLTGLDLGGANGSSFHGNWSAVHERAWLSPLKDLPVGNYSLTLHASNSIALPEAGVKEQPPPPFSLSLKGHKTLASATPVQVVRGVGVVQSRLTFLNSALPGGPASLLLRVTLNQQLDANDSLTLTLGGFDGPVGNTSKRLSILPSRDFTAYWTPYVSVLTLLWNGSSPDPSITWPLPRTYSIRINASQGLTYPTTGLPRDSADLTLSLSAAATGDCSPSPLSSSPGLGVLYYSRLEWSNPVAGQVTGLTFTFLLGPGDLEAGDVISLQLPRGLGGSSSASLSLSASENGTLFSGAYQSSSSLLTLTALQRIAYVANRRVSVRVSDSNGLSLPASGVIRGLPAHTVNVSVSSLSVPITPPVAVQEVGHVAAFRTLSLSYFPRRLARVPITLDLKFSLYSRLQPDDSIVLNLPGFSSGPNLFHRVEVLHNSTVNMTGEHGSSSHNFTGLVSDSFNGTSGSGGLVLTLFADSVVPAGAQVSLLIWSSLGLRLPVTGVVDNDARLTATLTSQAGSITQPVPIPTSTCVGFCSSSLAYNTSLAGSQVALGLSFTLSAPLGSNDSIRLYLPGFGGLSNSRLQLSASGVSASALRGAWSLAKQQLTLTVTSGQTVVAARTAVSVTVLGVNGLRLPLTGLPADDSSLQLSTNAYNLTCAGSNSSACQRSFTNYTAVLSSPAIVKRATVKYSSLSYTSRVAGGAVGLNLSLVMDSALSPTDSIVFTLPGFTTSPSGSRSNLSLSDPQGLFWASWDDASRNLTLTARGQDTSQALLPAGSRMNVSVLLSNGLRLPSSGLSANDTSLILWGRLANGYIPRQPVKHSPLVPGVLWSRLSYTPAQIHRVVQLQLSLHLTTSLSSSAVLTLHLPSFTGPSSIASLKLWANGTGAGAGVSGSWSLSSHAITLSASHGLASGVLGVTILAANALYLPSSGHPPNWSSLRLSVKDGGQGVSLNSTITSSPCVGICSSRLALGLRKKGYASPLVLGLQTSFNLTYGDRFFLHLGGFTAPALQGSSRANSLLLGGNHSAVFNATWSAAKSMVTLIYRPRRNGVNGSSAVLPAYTPIWLEVKRQNLILLPTTALAANDGRLGINVSAATFGNTSRAALTWSNPVGVLYYSELSYSTTVAGAATSLQLEFLSSSAIVAGERIQLDLPGFGSPSGLSQLSDVTYYWGGNGPYYPTVTWNRAYQYLTVVAASNMTAASLSSASASQVCRITIPKASGLTLPATGLSANDTRLRLSVLAAAGPIVSVSVGTSPGVGAVVQGSLSFDPATPGELTRLSLILELGGPLAKGDEVILSLPGFNRTGATGTASSSAVRVYTNSSQGTYFNATWLRSDSQLVFQAQTSIAAGPYLLVVPDSQRMQLPRGGLHEDDPRLTLSVNSTLTPIRRPVRVPHTDPVGVLLSSSLAFAAPAVAGEPAELRLQLRFSQHVGGSKLGMSLHLPGFTGPSRAMAGSVSLLPLLASSSSPGGSVALGGYNATWSNVTRLLNITLQPHTMLPPRRTALLTLPRAMGLSPPSAGLSSSSSGVTLAVNGTNGTHSLLMPVRTVQPVGAVLSSVLRFAPAIAGNVSSLHFNFSLSASLEAAETLTLLLPGFSSSLLSTSTTSAPLVLSTTPAGQLSATMATAPSGSGLLLTFTAKTQLSKAVVAINTTNAIRLPSAGLSTYSTPTSLLPRIATNALAEPIAYPGQVVSDVQSVALLSRVRLSFASTDPEAFDWVGGDRTLLRFPPSATPLTPDNVGDQYRVGEQVMTVVAVHGLNVSMAEAYRGVEIVAGEPAVWVSSPGYRPAYYRSGNGSSTLTFVYLVRPSDNTSSLESYNGTIYYHKPAVDWVRRLSMAPLTDVDPHLPLPGRPRSLSYNKDLSINTQRPHVLWVTSTKLNGTYALGDKIDFKVVFDKAVSVKASPASAKLVLPLLRVGVATSTSAPRFATYAGGSGSRELTFVYTVQAGDVSRLNGTASSVPHPDRLDYFDRGQDASPLRTIYGGYRNYIRRASTYPTTDADLSLALPGRLGSLSWQNVLLVNASAPRVLRVWTNASQADAGIMVTDSSGIVTVGAGANVYLFVQYSRPVTVDLRGGRPYIRMASGAVKQPARYVKALNGSSVLVFEYEVQDGDGSGDQALDYDCQCADFTQTTYIVLNGSHVRNASVVLPPPGSLDSLSHAGSPARVVVDTSRPFVLGVSSLTPDGTYGAGEAIDLVVTFSAAVTVYGSPRLELDTACHASYRSGNGSAWLVFRYVVEEGHGSGALDYRWTDSLQLNGGSIKRFSSRPQTGANLTLPLPGHWASLGFNAQLVIDTSRPRVQALSGSTSVASWNPPVQTLDLFCQGSNTTVPRFRLRYGEAMSTCLSCANASATLLQQALFEVGGSQLVAAVYEASRVRSETRFLVELLTAIGEASHLPIRIVSCTTGEPLASKATDPSTAATLHRANRDFSSWFQSGVVDVLASFTSPIVVLGGGTPYLDVTVGGHSRRALYSAGRSVQVVEVGVHASEPVTAGEFQLGYGGAVTGCIAWNVSSAIESRALRNRLLELPAVAALGLRNVTGERAGNGYRFTITFATDDPLPLQAVHPPLSDAGCAAMVPADALAEVPRSSVAAFRYRVRQGSVLTLTVRENVTMGAGGVVSFLLEPDARVTWPLLGAPRGVEDVSLAVSSEVTPIAAVTLPIRPLPAFLTSSLSFSPHCRAGNVTALRLGLQLNANLSVGDALNVTLPGFSGPGVVTTLVLNGSHASSFHATWQPQPRVVSLVVARPILAYQVVEVTVSASNQLVLPRHGLLRSDPSVRLSLSSPTTTGLVSYHAFNYTQPVGLAWASLRYGNPSADAVTDMTLELELGDDLLPGDQVHLHLPGFKAPRHTDRSLTLIDFQTWKVPTWLYNTPGFNVTPLATQGSLSSAFVADWYSHNETITLVAQTHLPACTPGSLTFLPRNQLSLPTLGLAPNDPRLRISIDAARMGRVNETAVPVSDGVGYFTTKLLDVQPQSPGAVVRVNLTFSLNADLKELEAVSVVLPGFYGCSNNSLALGGKHATLFDGHWLDESDTWQLVARQHVRNGTAVSVSLLPSNLVHFAKDGLIELPTISTNASLGPVRVPVAMNATRLGHFLTSEVSVSEASTDPNVTLGLRFRYNTAILPGTAFFLSFTGLRANLSLPDGNASSLWLSGANASAFGGLISQPDGSGGAVVFTLLATAGFAPGALVNLTLANSLGLRLPLTGLREADPRLTLWTNSTLAPMPAPETVAFSPPVGLFFSSLTFRTPQAGQRSAVDLALSASGRLHRGDRIRLRMPGFNSSARVLEAEPIGFTPGGPSGRFFLATWDPTIDTLALEVVVDEVGPVRQDLVLPYSLGLTVPANGTARGSPLFSLQADTMVMGLLRDVPLTHLQPVGSARTASLRFDPPMPGKAAALRLGLWFTMALRPSERVTLSLPGISAGADVVDLAMDAAAAKLMRADWIEAGHTLVLTCRADLPPRNRSLTIAASNGLTLPAGGFGVRHNFTISTDASAGPMPATWLQDFTPLGVPWVSSLTFLPRLSRTPVRVFERLWVVLTLHANFDLHPYDVIDLKVPGLFGGQPGSRNLTLNGTSAVLFWATWLPGNHTLRFQSQRYLPASPSSSRRLVLGPANSFRLPVAGLLADDPGVTLSSNASHGVMSQLPLTKVQGVGVAAVSLRVTPPVAGQVSSLSLRFQLSEDLQPSDKVYLQLPRGFHGPNSTALALAGPSASTFTASFANNTRLVNLTARTLVRASTKLWLTILPANGLRSPARGLPSDSVIALKADGSHLVVNSSVMLQRPITDFNSFGSLSPTSLRFQPAVAGEASTLQVNFTTSCALQPDDAVTLHLADFRRDHADLPLVLQGRYAGSFSAAFDACAGLLTLRAVAKVPAGHVLLMVAGNNTDSGIILPASGLVAGDARLQIASNASGCPVVLGRLNSSEAVPAVVTSSLSYSPARLQRSVAVAAFFNLTAALAVHDNVTFYLPGFTGPASSALALNGSLAPNFHATWQPSDSRLVLAVRRAVDAYTGVSLTVLDSNGLKLPPAGLAANDSRLTISFQASGMAVRNVSVHQSPAQGVLASSLSFDGSVQAGQVTTLRLGLTLSFSVTAGHNLTLTVALPGFRGPSRSNLFLRGGRADGLLVSEFDGSWDNATHTLSLNTTAALPAGDPFIIVVDRRNGLRLPTTGITSASKAGLVLRAYAVDFGRTDWLPIRAVPNVGAVLGASLSFGQRSAGSATTLSVNLTLSGNLTAGDQLVLGFGRFYRDWFEPVSLRGSASVDLQAAWSPGDYGELAVDAEAGAVQAGGALVKRDATWPVVEADLSLTHLLTQQQGGNSSSGGLGVFVDGRSAPSVVEVFSTLAGSPAVHYAGDAIDIRVRFTDAVSVVGPGLLVLLLDTGRPRAAVAVYDRGNNTDTLIFLYHVLEGDYTKDLSCFDSRSLYVSGIGGGAVLRAPVPGSGRPAVVPANLSLPIRCSRLARSHAVPQPLIVDGLSKARMVAVTTDKPNGTYGAGELVDLNVTFDVPLVVRGRPLLQLRTGANTTAAFTRGGRRQAFDLGVDQQGAAPLNGGFLVAYGDATSDCVTWNSSYNISTSIRDRLAALASVQAAGLGTVSVTQTGQGQGYRVVIAFSDGYPEPVSLQTAFCGGNAELIDLAPSASLIFRYIVAAGDAADPLDYSDRYSLLLPTGSAILLATARTSGNVNLLLPTPGQGGSLANSSYLVIDTAAPVVVSVATPTPAGAYPIGLSLTLQVVFDVPVAVTGVPRLALNVEPVQRYASYSGGSGSSVLSFAYTVRFPDRITALDVKDRHALQLPSTAATIRRMSQRPVTDADLLLPPMNTSVSSAVNLTVDYTAPARVVEVRSPLPNGTYTVGQEVPILVRFSSPVTLTGDASLRLDADNAFSSNRSYATYRSGSGSDTLAFLYVVQTGDNATRLNYRGDDALQLQLRLNGSFNSTILDSLGNHAYLGLYPAAADGRALNFSSAIRLTSQRPRAVYVTTDMANGTYGLGQDMTFTVLFSAPVAVVGKPRLQLQTFYMRPDAQAVYVNGSGTDRLTFLYTTVERDWGRGLPASTSQLVDYDGVGALAQAMTSDLGAAILANSTRPSLPAILWLPRQDQSLLARGHVLRVDPDTPRVVSVRADKNGSFGAGEDILIHVTFTAPVTVTGLLTMLLATGRDHGSCRYVPYVSGNETTELTFLYSVQVGDNATQLDYVDTRRQPYGIRIHASFAMVVSDAHLSAQYLPPLSTNNRRSARRTSTHPTTVVDLAMPLPGTHGSLGANNRLSIDTRPPTVVSVTTNVPDGTYGVGFVIDIFVLWSAPVTAVLGTPFLLLNTQPTPRAAPLVAGNNSANLTFRYVVQASDESKLLDYSRTDALRLEADTSWVTEGGSPSAIYRQATHPTTRANLTLPVPGRPRTVVSPKSLVGNRHRLRIDTSGLYVVSVDAGVADGRYGVGEQIPVSLVFTEPVTVQGQPALLMDVAVGYRAQYVNGSGSRVLNFVYTVRRGDNAERLGYRGQLACQVGKSNLTGESRSKVAVVSLPMPGSNGSLNHDRHITIDTSTCFVTNVTARAPPGRYGVGDVIALHVAFSDPITVIGGTPQLLLRMQGGGVARAPCSRHANLTHVLACRYVVAEGHRSGSLEYYDEMALVLHGAGVTLRASSTPLLEVDARLPCPDGPRGIRGTSGALAVVPDPPVVLAVWPRTPPGTYSVGDLVELRVRFSWPVKVVGRPRLLLNSGPTAQATYVAGSGTDTLAFNYVVGPSDATAALDYRGTGSLVLGDGDSIDKVSATQQQLAVLRLPVRGQEGSLARSGRLVINCDVPRVLSVFTDLRNGTYGPGTQVPLFVWFDGNVTVLGDRWPTLAIRSVADQSDNSSSPSSSPAESVVLAEYNGALDSTTLMFVAELGDGTVAGRLDVAGPYALGCPAGVRTCIATPTRHEEVDLILSDPTLYFFRPEDRTNGSRPSQAAGVIHSTTTPLVSGVSIVTAFDPAYGFGPGDTIVLSAAFSSPILPPRGNASDPTTPSLLLNVLRGGAGGSVAATYNRTEGWTLFFSYTVRVGDCVKVLDYFNTTALLGRVYRRRYGNASSVAVVTLAPPGTRGSISFGQKATIACERPQVAGVFPLKRGGLYVAGEPVFLVVRFTQPVVVTSGRPQLLLATSLNSSLTSAASYHSQWPLSANLNFDLLPTDLLFLYQVLPSDNTPRLQHAGPWALQLNGGVIMRRSRVPQQPVDRTLAPPGLMDDSRGSIRGQWWGDYARRVDVLVRGLWHEDVADLRLVLVHGNRSVALVDRPAQLDGYCFGRTLERPFQPRPLPAWSVGRLRPSAKTENLTEDQMAQMLIEQEQEGGQAAQGVVGESSADGVGRDYFFSDMASPNLATRAMATQSSTMYGADAERAIDGNTDGRWSFGSVSHTGLTGSGEAQPWWQLRFPQDEQPMRTVRIWNRVMEKSASQVQVVVVCGPMQPKGSFRLSFTFANNQTFTTADISTQAVAGISDERAGSKRPGEGSGESMQAKLINLGALGQVLVSRSASQLLTGYAWSLTFASSQVLVPQAAIAHQDISTTGPKLFTYVSRPGSSRDFYDARLNYSTTLFPCYLMVFNASVEAHLNTNVSDALSKAVYWDRLESTSTVTTVRLPKGTRGKFLRLQLAGLGFLSIAEVQVYADPMRSLSDYEGGRELQPRPATDPLQSHDPLMDALRLLSVQGPWSLQVMDMRRTRRGVGGGGVEVQSRGRGKVSDWVLLVTDYANQVRAYHMDVTASVTRLPKYGDLLLERPRERVTGWDDIFFGDKDEAPLPVGLSFRLLAPCYGVDTTGLNGVRSGVHRHCYQNFGVGWSLAPADTSTMAGWTFLDRERVLWYRPRTNFMGPDSFGFEVMVGVTGSVADSTVTVDVRNCRGSPGTAPDDPDPLCACTGDGRRPFGNATECRSAIVSTCRSRPRASVFASLCQACVLAPPHDSPTADCRSETDRALTYLRRRGMCAPAGSDERLPDCQTESFGLPAREAYVASGPAEPGPTEEVVPLSNANDGIGFMWTPYLA